MTNEPWYRDGLRFACTRCGNCCTGLPGTVRVSKGELRALARFHEMAPEDFARAFTEPIKGGGVSLRSKSNYDCVFWDREAGCTVYAHRPRQCRTWPFWRTVVATPQTWAEEARHCPGMNHGPHHDAGSVRRTSENDGTSGLPPGDRTLVV